MTLYFASVLPGLEYILADEMKNKILGIEIVQIKRGKVFYYSEQSSSEFKLLRTADNLFLVIDQFQLGPHKKHLSRLEQRIGSLDFGFADQRRSYWVNSSRKGKHTYSRFELAAAVRAGMEKRYPAWLVGSPEDHQLEFRLDVEHHEALFSLRLTDATFRYRGLNKGFTPASLRPTVAHAMVWLSDPQPTDIFIDPCCGSGSILSERLVYPFQRIMGGDLIESMVKVTRNNLEQADAHVQVWDARHLPFPSGYADTVVTNLPFGRQITPDEELHTFNERVMTEIARVLKTNGRAVILSESVSQMSVLAKRLGFSCLASYPLSLKGLHPTLFLFGKGRCYRLKEGERC